MKPLQLFADRVAHYPVLLFGAVAATIKWRWPHISTAGDVMVVAWITFAQTLFTASRKGLAEAKDAARNEALADVASLAEPA